ncbi:MAG TPA: chemotaxis protein CheW [Rhizomicrobium sp.]|nr:chemotaxis protein CheW [Rhizomicrobium sp.]
MVGVSNGQQRGIAGAGPEGADIQHVFATFHVAGQLFGVPVTRVQDILTPNVIARVPLGPAEVRGLINQRGRIVTVIDMHVRLALACAESGRGVCVTVDSDGELYTLLVDSVGDVVDLPGSAREAPPPTLDPSWADLSDGVFRMGDELLVALDVTRLLDIRRKN